MPNTMRFKDKIDKDFIAEVQEKCVCMGVAFNEEDFKNNPDVYLDIAQNYDARVKEYLHENRDRLVELQKKFAENNEPAFIALGRARTELILELNEKLANEREKNQNSAIFDESFEQPAIDFDKVKKDEDVSVLDRLTERLVLYKDNSNRKPLLEQNAKTLLKKDNRDYLLLCLKELNIKGQEAVVFCINLRRYNGSLGDFLSEMANVKSENNVIEAPQIDLSKVSSPKNEIETPVVIEDKKQKDAEAARIEAEKLAKEKELKAKAERKKAEKLAKEKELKAKAERKKALKLEQEKKKAEIKADKAKAKADKLKADKERKKAQKLAKEKKKAERELARLAKIEARRKVKEERARQRAERRQERINKLRTWFKGILGKKKKYQLRIVTPEEDKKSWFSRLFSKKQRKLDNIKLNIEKYREQQKQEKTNKILVLKNEYQNNGGEKKQRKNAVILDFKEKSKKFAKTAAIVTGLGFTVYGANEVYKSNEPIIKVNSINLNMDTFNIQHGVMDKAETYLASVNDFASSLFPNSNYSIIMNDEPILTWQEDYDKEPISQDDYTPVIPYIKNDILHNAPNIDFFNKCFINSNERYSDLGMFGITRETFNKFMSENRAVAKQHNINKFDNLTYDKARVVAKTALYDKYGIAYMPNKSIAAVMYNTLIKNQQNPQFISSVASSVRDFYELKGLELSENQSIALDTLANGNTVNTDYWRGMISAINATSTNPVLEEKLYQSIQQAMFVADASVKVPMIANDFARQAFENSLFAYTPTYDVGQVTPAETNNFADIGFLFDVTPVKLNVVDDEKILREQKNRDLETFTQIYQQCCYDNFVELAYDNNGKRKTFKKANKALKKFGLKYDLHSRFYCAGMSMASFCQAADIFISQYPDSHISYAIKDLLNQCENVHSCVTLKNDIDDFTQSVTKSNSLEKDVKEYMQKNDKAILFVWASRGGGNYHHQTLFQSPDASSDAYTYCAYNNNRWGNEKTFSRYMKSRSRYGMGGYFVDIGSNLDKLAENSLNKELENRKKNKIDDRNNLLSNSGLDNFFTFLGNNSR